MEVDRGQEWNRARRIRSGLQADPRRGGKSAASVAVDRRPVLRVLVVVDDPAARRQLSRSLTEMPDVEVAGSAATGREAFQHLARNAPHAVFLGLRLPDQRVLELLARIPSERRPAIVIVSAHAEPAARAYDFDVSDYVLEPVDRARLQRAVERVRRDLGLDATAPEDLPASDEDGAVDPTVGEGGFITRFLVPVDSRIAVVHASEVEWCEAAGNYVRLHIGRRRHAVRLSIQALERRLDPSEFCRIHRGAIVRLDRVRELRTNESGEYIARLHAGTEVAVSRSYRRRFLQALRST